MPTDSERSRQASKAQFPVAPGVPRVFFQYFVTPEELASYVRRAGFDVLESGLQRAPALTLLFPNWSTRLSLPQRHLLNRLLGLTLWWHPAFHNTVYCVGRKSGRARDVQ